ncbi:hypothetical protein AAC387_Pa12g2247 [Persea americana]
MIFFLVFMLLLASEAMVWGARARGLEASVMYSPPPPKALESYSPPPRSPVRYSPTKTSPDSTPPPPRAIYRPPPPRVKRSPPIVPVRA